MTNVGQVSVGLGLDDAKFKKGLGDAEKQTKQFASLMQKSLAGIAAGFTVSTVVKGINESVEAFRTQERAVASLNQALMNSGTYTAEYSQHLQDLSSEIQSFSNYGDEATEQAIALGQSFSGNVKLTDELIRATVDYAAATGQDLQSAFTLVGKSIGTQTNALARYGVSLEDGMSKEQKMTKITETLSQRFNGSAKTMSNASVQLKNAIGDLSEEFGTAFNPAVEEAQKLLAGLTVKATDALKNIRVATKDIKNLTLAEAELRLEQANSGASFTRNWKINKDYIKSIEDRIKVLKEEESLKAKSSKDNFIPIADTSTTKTTSGTNKALEEYQSFVEQYKQATREYEATLKARNYVEKTLGIKTTGEDYQTALNVYKEYFAKRKEIEESSAQNKASLLKMEETKLQQDLQTISLQKTDETAKKQWELIKGYQDMRKELLIKEESYKEAGGYLGTFATGYQERLNILQWYKKEYLKIQEDISTSVAQKEKATQELQLTYSAKNAEIEANIWRTRGQEVANIFNNTCSQLLTNYGDFSDNMKQLAINLSQYVLKEALSNLADAAINIVKSNTDMTHSFMNALSPVNQLSSNISNVALSAPTAAAGMSAMATAQTTLAPVMLKTNASIQQASVSYGALATQTQQLAVATAQLAVATAAESVAKIPFVGGFLAPVAATLTGAAIAAGTAMTAAAGVLGGAATKISSFNVGKHHSGGAILPQSDQTEHFALLKNNERVLSPSETSAYNQNESNQNGQNYIVYAPQIRAMDSRDVAQWFNDNKQQVLSIVSDGIKNNNQGLRTQIQGV